jgi:hypothetical protein
MTNTELKAQIDSQVTNKTAQKSITATNVGTNTKAVVDYVDQENEYYLAKLTQAGGGGITETVIHNGLGITVSYSLQATGTVGVSPSDALGYFALISNTSRTKTVKIPMYFTGFNGVFEQSDLAGALVNNFTDIYIRLSRVV